MKEVIPHNPAQVVEAVAANGNPKSRERVQGMVVRTMREDLSSHNGHYNSGKVILNVFPVRTAGGGVKFINYPRVPY